MNKKDSVIQYRVFCFIKKANKLNMQTEEFIELFPSSDHLKRIEAENDVNNSLLTTLYKTPKDL